MTDKGSVIYSCLLLSPPGQTQFTAVFTDSDIISSLNVIMRHFGGELTVTSKLKMRSHHDHCYICIHLFMKRYLLHTYCVLWVAGRDLDTFGEPKEASSPVGLTPYGKESGRIQYTSANLTSPRNSQFYRGAVVRKVGHPPSPASLLSFLDMWFL